MYRYFVDEEEGGMWKERGVGDIRILKHNNTGSCRILMRRDKTLKLCANHARKIRQHLVIDSQLVFTCSMLTIEALKQGVKYI